MVAPTSPNSFPISALPLARPHFAKYTWLSSANRSRMLPPVDVTPPLSNALRYSRATDLRCSSVIVFVVTATVRLLSHVDHHVLVDPRRERVAVARDGIPVAVEVVVPRRVADGEAGAGTVGDRADGVEHPCGQHHGVGAGLELLDDLL